MSHSSLSYDRPVRAAAPKGLWEDPCITLERDLEVRAQGGPGDSFSNPGMLGPLNASGDACITPVPGG